MNCCCDGVSVNKKPIKRARNTLLLLFQQESQPTSSSNNGKPTNQTGRAEPAANANKQQQQQRQRKQLRRRFCGDCTFFQHTTRNTPPCGAQSASTATAAAATVPIRKVFQCSPATRRVVTNVARVALSCAVYVCACVSVRENERERRCLPFVKFHCQFVSYETEMALQQQRSTTAGVAKKHVESSFFSCSLPLTHSLTHIETARKHVCGSLKLPVTSNTKLELPACVCLSLSLSMYSS